MKVFIKPGCPWCVDAVNFLRNEGYAFEEIDVIADPVAFHEMEQLSGQTKAPTLVTEEKQVLPDFDVDELKAFFNEHGITP